MRPEALERGCCHCISHLAISPGARVGEAGLGAPGWTGLLQFQAESLEIQVLTWVSLGKNEEVVAAGGTSGLERAEFFKSISRQMGPAKANQTSMESVLERGSVGKGGGTLYLPHKCSLTRGQGSLNQRPTLGFLRAPRERPRPWKLLSWQQLAGADSLPPWPAWLPCLPSGTFSSCSLKRPLLSTLTAGKHGYSPLPSSFTKVLKVQCLMSH